MPDADPTRSPLPIPRAVDRVVLFGGSFDPPHAGHVSLGLAARDAVDTDARAWLVFVPAARSPHKDAGPEASAEDRTRMLALALGNAPRVTIWDEEIRRGERAEEPSYWVDTLEEARRQLGAAAELRFVIGADQVLAFPRWHRWRDILDLADPIVLMRRTHGGTEQGLLDEAAIAEAWAGQFDADAWRARIVDAPLVDVSSTEIRRALREGAPDIPGISPGVLSYIRERGLYRAGDPVT